MAEASSFAELRRIILDQIVHPVDRQWAEELIRTGIENYLRAGLRRQSFRFRLRGRNGEPEPYDVTLLRSNVNQKNRSLVVLCRKTEGVAAAGAKDVGASHLLADSAFCCRNDRYMTLVEFGNATVKLAGYDQEELARLFRNQMIRLVHPEDRLSLQQTMTEQFRQSSVATAQ
jgi:hypothetical protein